MKAIGRYLEHVLVSTIKGFFFTGIVATVLCIGILVATRNFTFDVTSVLAAFIVLLAALLGGVVMLAYRLTHIEEISHAIKHIAAHVEEQGGQARLD